MKSDIELVFVFFTLCTVKLSSVNRGIFHWRGWISMPTISFRENRDSWWYEQQRRDMPQSSYLGKQPKTATNLRPFLWVIKTRLGTGCSNFIYNVCVQPYTRWISGHSGLYNETLIQNNNNNKKIKWIHAYHSQVNIKHSSKIFGWDLPNFILFFYFSTYMLFYTLF